MTSINDLQNDPKNARKRTDRSSKLIKESLQKFGAARSIVIDENNRILAGNGTIAGAKAAGIKNLKVIETDGNEIIAVKRTGLSEDEKVGLALADNRTSDLSEWDLNMLEELSQEHDLNPWFDNDDLKELLGETEILPSEGLTDPDDVPKVPEEPITNFGDIWQLGNHKLLCGDSTDQNQLQPLMQDELANLWLTDPPYNVNYEGSTEDKLKIQNDNMSDLDFRQFLASAYIVAHYYLNEGASFYIWHADLEGYNFRGAAKDANLQIRQCLIWVKSSMVMGRQDYHWQHEPCLYGWKKGASHFWNADRKQTTVLNFDKPHKNKEHPTMKPVDLFQYQITNSSKPGDIILDTFGGSGTTLIAAERIQRQARLVELDPKYCDVIVKRWEDFTGKTAERVSSN
jgi:site-specific DNA-methyltransferase (adenine-specific)